MSVLIGIALKSLLIAGVTLGLLQLLKARSAAERSWVAHIGLLALIIMAFAPLVLPGWNVAVPIGGDAPTAAAQRAAPAIATPAPATVAPQVLHAAPAPVSLSPLAATTAAYAVPAAILLFITFLALARLIALRARAEVLVDGHWLSALARAQRRMGFKHGTALLTSDDLASPISWGLMRPVILLNTRAVEASDEAEAIIAHELAHVARMDWAKLLLARLATALFWFNPLVWILAREAHQLREEAADDSVLAADIPDTDYAQLLVGVARHECPGLLLGAHGVAPSKSSLARRVARVLDGKTVRGPVARSFAAGVFVGAVAVAAPLAALTLTPKAPEAAKKASPAVAASTLIDTSKPYYSPSEVPADLPHIIAQGVSTSVSTAVAAVSASQPEVDAADAAADRADAEREAAMDRTTAARERAVEKAQDAAERANDLAARYRDKGFAMRSVGVTPQYVAAIRSVAPHLARTDPHQFIAMRSVGVTPAYVQALSSAGLNHLTLDQLVTARSIGLSGDYVRSVIAAGARPDVEELVVLRTMGIRADQVAQARKAGAVTNSQIIEHATDAPIVRGGISFPNVWPFNASRPKPPAPPAPPAPRAEPPDNNADDG